MNDWYIRNHPEWKKLETEKADWKRWCFQRDEQVKLAMEALEEIAVTPDSITGAENARATATNAIEAIRATVA